jgi:hypothetical protein
MWRATASVSNEQSLSSEKKLGRGEGGKVRRKIQGIKVSSL